MKKIFIDLWIKEINEEIIYFLDKLGFIGVAVEDLSTRYKKINNLVIVKKAVISAEKRSELRKHLRGIKNKTVIVSVKPLSIEAARMAAHDGRVDTIIIDKDSLYYIDKAQINMMKQFSKPLEIPLNDFLKANRKYQSMIYRRINLALQRNIPLIISSHATKTSELLNPVGATYLSKILFDINIKQALIYLTSFPREIIVANGVKI
ncbi:RNase P subunit p30 family protein [Staphylothermus hellenicus]|uniref:RNase P subunit p30 n=1 Tax=Staphylothermus hellenicus (strain DSM 12710 / JCM 10830 / BK20S6-10-b1 / P8) TaxID=591019 RepID=D7DAA6_STAHD|nr:RNase P subunit p30 family protein [Staphylothermus hellenicus]ADI32702.1 RNase P subunit p30 [Staphylothermus hellenicus DSM 12710]